MAGFGPLKVGQQVDLDFFRGESRHYRSKVENISDKSLEVLSPMQFGAVVPMPEGLSVKVSYYDDLAIHFFVSHVIKQRMTGFSTVTIAAPAKVNRIQRRDYVRFDISLEIEVQEPQSGEKKGNSGEPEAEPEDAPAQAGSPPEEAGQKPDQLNEEPKNRVITGQTSDISGGGFMFRCNAVLKMGDILDIKIILGKDEFVQARGKVVRFFEAPIKAKYKYSVGIQFTEIKERERDKIIKFIFKKQLELRKKGLI